jgi:hypothetical protein
MRTLRGNIVAYATKDPHVRRPTLLRQRHLHHRRQRALLVRPTLGWRSARGLRANVLGARHLGAQGCDRPSRGCPWSTSHALNRDGLARAGHVAHTANKKRQLAAYFGTLVVMVGLDLLWLGLVAKPMYQQGIGHLMANQPDVPVARGCRTGWRGRSCPPLAMGCANGPVQTAGASWGHHAAHDLALSLFAGHTSA